MNSTRDGTPLLIIPSLCCALKIEHAHPWISQVIQEKKGGNCKVLDIGCGAGFLTNALAKAGHRVTGVDLFGKESCCRKEMGSDGLFAILRQMPMPSPLPAEFDVICAMDFLEHIERPKGDDPTDSAPS